MFIAVWVALCLIASASQASEYHLIDTREVYVNAKQFLPNGYSPYMSQGSELNKGIDLHIKTDVLVVGYVDQMVWSLIDQSQFRWVGWNYKIGIRTLSFLDIEYEHFSRHVLDRTNPFMTYGARFPVEDSIGVNIYLYRKDRPPVLSDFF